MLEYLIILREQKKRREIYIASVGKKVNLRAGMAALGEE